MPDGFESPASLPAGLAEPAFDPNALRVLKERYFAKQADGTTESPREFVWRVASSIAKPEAAYAPKLGREPEAVVDGVSHAFYDMMVRRDFMPNTPCLVNAGRPLSMLSACFVLPVPDSIEGIFYNLKAMALVQKAGGGTGFAFSSLRQQGAGVESTGKDASGPVSFMKVFNAATDSIKQGGVRRGANMGVLKVDHPDIFEFMRCKKELDAENRALWNRLSDTGRYTPEELAHIKQELLQTQINNFNISIGVTDAFMAAVKADTDFELRDPRTHDVARTVRAREIWDAIVEGAWQNGEPGVLFLDHPEVNPLPGLGPIEATNPCVTGDTWVLTADGPRLVSDLVGVPFDAIVDGQAYASTGEGFFFKGIKPVYELRTNDGYLVNATEDHKIMTRDSSGAREWKALGTLQPGDTVVLHDHGADRAWPGAGTFDEGWLLGSLVGDGHFHKNAKGVYGAVLDFWGDHAPEMAAAASRRIHESLKVRSDFVGTAIAERNEIRLKTRAVFELAAQYGITPENKSPTAQIERASSDFQRGFLQAWFDADGTVGGTTRSGHYARLTATSLVKLESAQRMLSNLGIHSRIDRNRRRAQARQLPDSKGGFKSYECQAYHELSIGRADLPRFRARVGFSQPDKSQRLDGFIAGSNAGVQSGSKVVAIVPLGDAPVFDCTIPGPHAFSANSIYVQNCGEQFLHGYDSCNLGSINVGHFYDARAKDVDWERLAQTTALAIRFLDNVIDANLYPIDEIRDMVTNNRRVGLGIMGFADLLIQMQIAYGSPEAIAFSAKLMSFIQQRAEEASEVLARERGDFPNKHLSVWADDARPRRNAALLSIAPTGTISMIAGCSFGCEPYFGMAYTKHVMKDAEGRPQHLYYVIPLFEEISKDEGFYSEDLLAAIEENRGSVKGLPSVPKHWQEVFTTSADVSVDQHIDMLAAFQKYTDNAVSKCVAAGTLIPTDKGLIPIEELGRAQLGEFGSLNGEYRVIGHDGRPHRITGFYNNGTVPTVRIRLKNGATLEASESHHVLTVGGWKAMSEIAAGDLVVGRFEEQSGPGGEPIDASVYPFRNTATPVTLPERMTPDLALWLGMMAADGHTVESTGNVGISEKDASGDVATAFDRLCIELFSTKPRVVTDARTGVRTRYLTSHALSRYVAGLLGKGAAHKRVPEQVLRGSFAEKVAFLNGVTLDGFIAGERNALVVYAGMSARLADGLEALCRSLGVPSCWRWTSHAAFGDVHQVRVTAELQELLEPVETRKKVSSKNPQRLVRVPETVFSIALPHTHPEFSNLRSLKQRRPESCFASTLEKLEVPLSDPREYLARVENVSRGEAPTFDIEVEDAHSYVVNGIVSHNTINAPNDDTRENVSRAIFRAYEAGCKGFTYYRDGSRTEQVVTFSKDNDLKGGNRDIAAPTAAAPVAPEPVSGTYTGTEMDLDIDALLAKANALLEVQ